MVNTTIDEFVRKKLHLGHPTRDWNPKMAPYIYTKRNGFYIIDLLYTYSCLQKAKMALQNAAAQESTFLFVGTKRQASALVKYYAQQCNAFYINHKWSGGLLTNWQTVSAMTRSLEKLSENNKKDKPTTGSGSKQEMARLEKQRQKLEKVVGGIREMKKLPDVVIIIGAAEENNAVRECNKLGIPIVTILDTNCDPKIATWGVPANDDSVTSIDTILREFSNAIISGTSFSKKYKA